MNNGDGRRMLPTPQNSAKSLSWFEIDEIYSRGKEIIHRLETDREFRNEWYYHTKLCNSVEPLLGHHTSCRKKYCYYAHSLEEVLPVRCAYAEACIIPECKYWHPEPAESELPADPADPN